MENMNNNQRCFSGVHTLILVAVSFSNLEVIVQENEHQIVIV